MVEKLGELLVFDYAPNLKIVGCFHALSNRDKVDLEHLIEKSEFVAIESDEIRMRKGAKFYSAKGKLTIPPIVEENGEEMREYKISGGDYRFLRAFLDLNDRSIDELNQKIKLVEGVERNGDESEMEFSYKVSKALGKPVYLVDMPTDMILMRLCNFPSYVKIIEVLSLKTRGSHVKRVMQFMHSEREEYMLRMIEQNEGPVGLLERKGLLIVGVSHAINFYNQSRNG